MDAMTLHLLYPNYMHCGKTPYLLDIADTLKNQDKSIVHYARYPLQVLLAFGGCGTCNALRHVPLRVLVANARKIYPARQWT